MGTFAYERFRALHDGPGAFIMPNPWDGASALILKRAGFAALGTSSFAIALGLGVPMATTRYRAARRSRTAAFLAALTGLPVNGDLEDGFGAEPADVAATVEAAIAGGPRGSASRTPPPIHRARSTTSTTR